jgi:hypothetical protein
MRLWLKQSYVGTESDRAVQTTIGPGLPDGILSNQKFQFGSFLEALAMEDVGIFHDHLVYFVAIWYNLCFCIHMFPRFGL